LCVYHAGFDSGIKRVCFVWFNEYSIGIYLYRIVLHF